MQQWRCWCLVLSLLALWPGTTAAVAQPRPFCPDRPGLGTPSCTVERGRVVVELGVMGWTLDRQAAERTDSLTVGDLLLRYGLADNLEVQAGWGGFGHVRARSGERVTRAGGSGDMLLAVRRNFANPDGSGFSLAAMPYLTLPTGVDGVGAGDWAAGLLLPVGQELAGDLRFGFTGSFGVAVDADRQGRHLFWGGVAGLDFPLGDALGATVEISAQHDRDPAAATTAFTAGLSAGWTPAADLQIDFGVAVGLDRDAPDLQLGFGIAHRF